MNTNLIISEETLAGLESKYLQTDTNLNWNLVFSTPAWLKVWWQSFGAGSSLYLRSISQNNQLIGIAPLQIKNRTASIVGNVDVCDYQDFITVQGKEAELVVHGAEIVMVFWSNAMVPLNANALPFSVAPVFSVIDASAMMVPEKLAVVPSVAWVPTCQKMLSALAPPANVTCTPLLILSSLAI